MSGRCKACDVALNELEMCATYAGTTEYIDLCFRCLCLSGEGEEVFDDLFDEEHHEE